MVGVDNSSAEYIPETKELPKIGSRTTLNPEGILSLKPTLIITTADAGPPQVIEQLQNSGITVFGPNADFTVETSNRKFRRLPKPLDRTRKPRKLTPRLIMK